MVPLFSWLSETTFLKYKKNMKAKKKVARSRKTFALQNSYTFAAYHYILINQGTKVICHMMKNSNE